MNQYVGAGEKLLSWENEHFVYNGRIDFEYEGGPLWVYPCSFVKVKFIGKSIKAVVTNIRSYWGNSVGWILDGEEGRAELPDEGCACITIAENLDEKEHELCFFKRMDSCHMMIFHGFIVDEGMKALPAEPLSERRIEVYGDSVSAGEVSEAVEYCGMPDPEHNGEYSNSYYSYAWITARKLKATLHDIAQGGIALFDGTGYFNGPDTMGLLSMYDKIQYMPGKCAPKKWDFAKYIPQVVILAFGQNDNHPEDYMKEDYDGDKARKWRAGYMDFIKTIRSIYPDCHIICKTTILGHDFNWDRAIEECVNTCGDDKVHYFKYSNNSVGTQGHIRKPEAEQMAEELGSFIQGLNEKYGFWD